MFLSHIVACTKSGVIGREGAIPWHISEDLQYFKRVTMGHVILMGRKTYDSIGRPLPGRMNIVMTRNQNLISEQPDRLQYVTSVAEALSRVASLGDHWPEQVFVIGGGVLYEATKDRIKKIYLTEVAEDIAGDTYYPVQLLDGFTCRSREEHLDAPIPYVFCEYVRHGDGTD